MAPVQRIWAGGVLVREFIGSLVLWVGFVELVADLLKHVLEREGFAVTCCHSGDAALTLLNAQVFDLAILDIMMPGIDGFEVCRQIRGGAAGSNTDMPIVFLSAKTEEFDKVLGFTLGADDYVTKPFNPRELVARLKARLRGRSAFSSFSAVGNATPRIAPVHNARLDSAGHRRRRGERQGRQHPVPTQDTGRRHFS